MKRIKFKKGKQREFIKRVILETNSPSLRELSRRVRENYSTLKNYFNESRLIPENLFFDFLEISKIDKKSLDFEIIFENWGQVIGGRKSRKQKLI